MSELKRFIDAQAQNYDDALREIRNGRKTSCWMWYVFPQIKGLGQSITSKFYGIKDLQEAKDYLNDSILGKRLKDICEAALEVESNNASKVFGSPDDMKLRSSMTLFELAAPDDPIFGKVLDKYFEGRRDMHTIQIVKKLENGDACANRPKNKD